MKVFKRFGQPIIVLLAVQMYIVVKAHSFKFRGHFECTNWERQPTRPRDVDEFPDDNIFTQEDGTVASTITKDGVTTNSNNVTSKIPVETDCFETIGNESFLIKNNSSTVDGNCTRRTTCKDGKTYLLNKYNCSPDAVCEMRNNVSKCYCIDGYHGDGEICSSYSDCLDVFRGGNKTTNGVYAIKPSSWTGPAFEVYCNMDEGGGWTVLQRRVNGSVNFSRDWQSYKEGFGELEHEFWLGNDKLYHLTNQGDYQLWIDLRNVNGEPYYAAYDLFRINDESDNFRFSQLGAYSGTAGDSFRYDLNHSFTTLDRDNDLTASSNCAEDRRGGWWHWQCTWANLNGDFNGASDLSTIYWKDLPASWYKIKYVEMKIRPKI